MTYILYVCPQENTKNASNPKTLSFTKESLLAALEITTNPKEKTEQEKKETKTKEETKQ